MLIAMQGSSILIIAGGALEVGGFMIAMSRLLEVRGISPGHWLGAVWSRLRFMPVPRTHTLRHGAEVLVVRDSASYVKKPAWDAMDTEAQLIWLRDQQHEHQLRLNRHAAAIENEPVLRDAALSDLARELRSEIRDAVDESEFKDVAKETYSVLLFVTGLVLGTIGNLV